MNNNTIILMINILILLRRFAKNTPYFNIILLGGFNLPNIIWSQKKKMIKMIKMLRPLSILNSN